MRGPSLAAALALALLPAAAAAALGDGIAGVEADRLAAGGARQTATASASTSATASATTVQRIVLADGGAIREYLTPAGIVCAVAWNLRTKPNLERLLGQRFATYAEGARQAMRAHPGPRHAAVVRAGDVVVESTGQPGAWVGRAWAPSLLPQGTNADALR